MLPTPRTSKSRKRRSTNVPGQFLGYSLQVTRLTHLLIQAETGSFGSLEVLDDIAIGDAHGGTIAVQSKSALTGNPLSNNSAVFWKTLANWADALATGSLPGEKLQLVIYLSKPATGQLAELLAGAKSLDEAKAAVAGVREHFALNPLPTDSGALPHLERFFGHKPEVVERVVHAFRIECGSGSPQSDLVSALDNIFFKQGLARQLAALAQGWVKQRVDEMIERGAPAIIDRDVFHREMQVFHTKFVERSILQSFAKGPTPQDVEEHRARIYVRQLEIINADFEDQIAAISNYFRATSDRTNWGASGVVQKDSFDQLIENLVSTWKNHRRMTGIRDGQRPPTEQGQLLLAECMNHTAPVENLQAPSHFIPGCFHELADKLTIGWHPDYLNVLAGTTPGGSH